jgi:hypothetical protein
MTPKAAPAPWHLDGPSGRRQALRKPPQQPVSNQPPAFGFGLTRAQGRSGVKPPTKGVWAGIRQGG